MLEGILRKRNGGGAGTLAIIAVSAILGMLIAWRAPGVDRYARDWLMRARGTLAAPDDIAIVAIDEPSIARFGRFPWSRSIMAKAISAVAAAEPKAIALDVLYSDPTTGAEDSELASAIADAGNVAVAAQLVDPAAWLLPLPLIGRAAAATGHVNVLTESEGVARELLVRVADAAGRSFRAMAVEAVRVGDGTPEQAVTATRDALIVGSRVIPLQASTSGVVIGTAQPANSTEVLHAGRMAIDYIGPAGSFSSKTYSIADVGDGRVPPVRLRGRYVLIGATAASIGDRLSSPFIHHADVQSNQHGTLMPGVEVLANAVNTILRSRFYSETSDWAAFLWAALVAAATLGLLAISQGRHALLKQIGALIAVSGAVVLCAYVAFTRLLIIPPVTPGLVSFASAGLLGLLRRSLIASAHLDESIAEIAHGDDLLVPEPATSEAAEAIAKLADAAGVAIFAVRKNGRHVLVASHGVAALPLPAGYQLRTEPFPSGELAIAHPVGRAPARETLHVCRAIAASCVNSSGAETHPPSWAPWPQGLEDKARALSRLNSRMLGRTRFVDLALRSVEDGLIITGPDSRITFANRSAAGILESTERALLGRNFFERLSELDAGSAPLAARETLTRLLVDRVPVEREIAVRGARPRQYILRLAAVSPRDDGAGNGDGPVLGIVASFSDITRHNQLQQTKNDVISLVTHEMRTPLSAIQGMSELLANYDLEPARRREMNLAINDEVKRLTRMITEYLDITRLESGATVMRRSPVRIETLLERTLLLLEPVAAQRNIRLTRSFAGNLPALLADPDLLSRAVDNLVSNAIKYSPPGSEVVVFTRETAGGVAITVADRGYGIPAADLGRIFEKFYRVPRVQDADVPGTGLGLALVREIAELHGGAVTVESEVNVGSTFCLTIPHAEAKP